MVKRTGMFEAPSNVVSVTPVHSGMADTSEVWAEFGRTARDLMDLLQPVKNRVAERQAARDYEQGRVRRRLQFNPEDEIYNNAMEQSYLLGVERDLDDRIMRLEGEHAADAEGFTTAFASVREAMVAGAAPDFAEHVGRLLDQRETEAVGRIGQRVRNAAIQSYAQNATARLAQMEARLTGYDDIASPEFQTAFSEYEQTGAAIAANPLSGITGEEWAFRRNNFHSRLAAQQVALQAERMYEEGGGNAESAHAALAFMEERMRDPELVLTEAQRDASFNEARRNIYRREADRRRSERELAAQLRSLRAEANNEARDLIAGGEAMAQTFTVIPDDEMAEIASAVAASGSAARAREFNELAIANAVRARLQGLSLSEIEGAVQAFRAEAQTGNSDAAIALQEAERYRNNLRRIDSVTGLQLHMGEEPAPLQQGLRPRIRQMEDYAEGVGRRETTYLTPGERELIAGELQRGGEQSLSIVRGIVSEAMAEPGNGRLRAQRILSEVAGRAGPEYSAIGNVFVRGGNASANTARNMVAALDARRQEGYRRAALLPQSHSDGTETAIIADVLGEQGLSSMTAEELAEIRLAADLAYEGRAINDPGAYATRGDYERAYRGAVQNVLGSVTREVNGRIHAFGGVAETGRRLTAQNGGGFGERTMENAVVIPNWIRRDQFPNVYRSLTLNDFATASGGQVPAGGTVADWRSARLIPTGREIGEYYLLDQNGARYMVGTGANRQPYVLNFGRLRASLAERRPDAVVP